MGGGGERREELSAKTRRRVGLAAKDAKATDAVSA